MGTTEFNAGGNPAMDWHPIQVGVEIFLVASCHGNRDKLRPDGLLGSYADLTFKQCCTYSKSQDAQALSVNHKRHNMASNYKGLYGIFYKISMEVVKSENSQ